MAANDNDDQITDDEWECLRFVWEFDTVNSYIRVLFKNLEYIDSLEKLKQRVQKLRAVSLSSQYRAHHGCDAPFELPDNWDELPPVDAA